MFNDTSKTTTYTYIAMRKLPRLVARQGQTRMCLWVFKKVVESKGTGYLQAMMRKQKEKRKEKRAGGGTRVLEHLPSMLKSMGQSPRCMCGAGKNERKRKNSHLDSFPFWNDLCIPTPEMVVEKQGV